MMIIISDDYNDKNNNDNDKIYCTCYYQFLIKVNNA